MEAAVATSTSTSMCAFHRSSHAISAACSKSSANCCPPKTSLPKKASSTRSKTTLCRLRAPIVWHLRPQCRVRLSYFQSVHDGQATATEALSPVVQAECFMGGQILLYKPGTADLWDEPILMNK